MGNARNIGGLATTKKALSPRNQVDAAALSLVGTGIDASGLNSLLFVIATGPSTGAPASVAVAAQLQDSADDTTYAAVAASPSNPTVAAALAAQNTRTHLEVDTTSLRRYVRLAFTVTHTGGASPTTGLMAEAVALPVVGPPVHA